MAYSINAPAEEQIAEIKMRAEALVRVGHYGDLKEPEWQPLIDVRLPNGEPVLGVAALHQYDFRIMWDPYSIIAVALARRIVTGIAPDAQSGDESRWMIC